MKILIKSTIKFDKYEVKLRLCKINKNKFELQITTTNVKKWWGIRDFKTEKFANIGFLNESIKYIIYASSLN